MYQVDSFLNGDIDEMIDALYAAERAAKLADTEEQQYTRVRLKTELFCV